MTLHLHHVENDAPPDAHIAKALTLLRAMSWGASKYRPKLDIINDVHRCCDEAIAELQAAVREGMS